MSLSSVIRAAALGRGLTGHFCPAETRNNSVKNSLAVHFYSVLLSEDLGDSEDRSSFFAVWSRIL